MIDVTRTIIYINSMKPDKNICLNCRTEISLRAKYCSDKCRKQYERNPDKRSDITNPDTDKSQVGQTKSDTFRDSLTKTDKTFYDRAMRDFKEPYYKFDFDEPIQKKECAKCGNNFKTRLHLLIYCSYDHYAQTIGGRK